ncbi:MULTISPECIES: hypothetical protein [Clavibacter]|uniref:Integral membrane protein n=2 Tax=Clavibacter TaxID=1573 RepID=A0A399P2S2_9MICO|nr:MULTISPECIES: hypothetical protein [Clavibacter]KDP89800.1 hypothetical protein W824_15005 [Clavibacter cf. michiganensis LMG 26808]RII99076.1 hypothetical protein DZF96_00080 [Clavibacter michiganensis]UKF26694.1 hypothetical protein KYT88_15875 [Clavibacter sp. A6099]
MLITYLAAVVLVAFALTRLPSAIRGQNVLIASSATAVAVAFALITPPVYSALDVIAPFPNFVDLVAKLALFVGLLLAGTQVARAWDAPSTQRLVSGGPGLLVFLAVFLLEVIFFALVHDGAHAPDLVDQLSDVTSRAYSTIATAYPAYIAALLLPHLRATLMSTNRTGRATATFLFVGFGLAIVRFGFGLVTLAVPAAYYAGQAVSAFAAVFVALGLATAFFSRIVRKRRAAQSSI